MLTELKPGDLLLAVDYPHEAEACPADPLLQEEVETSKNRAVCDAGFMHGDARGLEVKREEMDRLSSMAPPQAFSKPQPSSCDFDCGDSSNAKGCC